jgi:SAM-dependent methyltransferase
MKGRWLTDREKFIKSMSNNIQYFCKVKSLLEHVKGDCLDVGCGNGYILTLIANQLPENKHTGVEYNPDDYSKAAKANTLKNVRIILGDIRDLQLGKFDTIILSHVLEHMTDPAGLLIRMKGLLRPGGQMLIIVPNKSGLLSGSEGWGDISIHYWKFDADSLSFLLERLGFSYEKIPTSLKIPLCGRMCKRYNFLFGLFYALSTSAAKLFGGRAYELFYIVK